MKDLCFRCQKLGHYASKYPNKNSMILSDNEEVELASDESKCESMSALEDASNVKDVVNG
jgi:hypothetical protein